MGNDSKRKEHIENAENFDIAKSAMTSFSDRLWESIGNESVLSFAKRAGVSEGVVRKYVKGNAEPTVSRLIAMANAAGVSLNWLATGDGTKTVNDCNTLFKSDINIPALSRAIELLDEALLSTNKSLDSFKKAELISALYELEVSNHEEKRRDAMLMLLKSIG
ncbi:TPA: helix-turn-helix transcriptional regulator [Providencia alcalifaciens]|nr:helix-turn-helix transcriptional regulator [Providencia alcalifaciens]